MIAVFLSVWLLVAAFAFTVYLDRTMSPRGEDTDRWEHPALTAARKTLTLRKGKPTDADRPPPSTFPRGWARKIEGQTSLDDEPCKP